MLVQGYPRLPQLRTEKQLNIGQRITHREAHVNQNSTSKTEHADFHDQAVENKNA